MNRNHASTSDVPPVFDEGSVTNMPPSFDRSIPKKPTDQVSILNNLLKSCLALVKNEDSLEKIWTLIKEPKRGYQQENNVNHIDKRLKIGRELRMNAQIGDYDMDFFILDLGS